MRTWTLWITRIPRIPRIPQSAVNIRTADKTDSIRVSDQERRNTSVMGRRSNYAKRTIRLITRIFAVPDNTQSPPTLGGNGDAVFKDAAGDSASNVGRIFSTVGSGRQIQAVGTNDKPSSSRVSILISDIKVRPTGHLFAISRSF